MPTPKPTINPPVAKAKRQPQDEQPHRSDNRNTNPRPPRKAPNTDKQVERRQNQSSANSDGLAAPIEPYTSTESTDVIAHKVNKTKNAATDSHSTPIILPQGIRDIFRNRGLNGSEDDKVRCYIQGIQDKAQKELEREKRESEVGKDEFIFTAFNLRADLRELDVKYQEGVMMLKRTIISRDEEISSLKREVKRCKDYITKLENE